MAKAKFTWTDHSDEAGFVFQSKRTGAVVYNSDEQGLDPSDNMKYTVVCVHGRLIGDGSKRVAKFTAGHPGYLCPACDRGDFTERELIPEEERM